MKYLRSTPLLAWLLFVAVTGTVVVVAVTVGENQPPAATRPYDVRDDRAVWALTEDLANVAAATGRGDADPARHFAAAAATAATAAPETTAATLTAVADLAGELAEETENGTDPYRRQALLTRIGSVLMSLSSGDLEGAAALAAAPLDITTPSTTPAPETGTRPDIPELPDNPPATMPTPGPLPAPEKPNATLPEELSPPAP